MKRYRVVIIALLACLILGVIVCGKFRYRHNQFGFGGTEISWQIGRFAIGVRSGDNADSWAYGAGITIWRHPHFHP